MRVSSNVSLRGGVQGMMWKLQAVVKADEHSSASCRLVRCDRRVYYKYLQHGAASRLLQPYKSECWCAVSVVQR
jgi:hypothetical protein